MTTADDERLDELVEAAARALFAAHGLVLGELDRDAAGSPQDHDVAASIGFVGAGLRGALLMTARIEALARTWPPELSQYAPSDEAVCDWAGELVNQLLGRVKNVLVTYGYPLEQSTPTIVTGLHVRRAQGAASIRRRYAFAANPGWIVIFFDVDPADGFSLSGSPDPDAQPVSEGEVRFF